MNALRVLAIGIVVGLLSTSARAEEKKDAKPDYAKLLIGKWEATKVAEGTIPVGTVAEFTKDGKFKVSGKEDGAEMSFDGTYTVKDNTFTFKLKIGDMEMEQTITITKISETELATKNKEDKVVELKKKK